MKKILIRTGTGEAFNAASKARRDAETIATRAGYVPFDFAGKRTADGSLAGALRLALDGMRNWRRLIREAEEGSLVLVQYPHYPMKSARLMKIMIPRAKKKKGLKFAALAHDLDSQRGLHGQAAVYSDTAVLPLFDVVICHNEAMKRAFFGTGIPEGKLVVLGAFDYLTGTEMPQHRPEDGIAVAGNLSPEKCGYVTAWLRQGGETPVHLYGKGLEAKDLPARAALHGPVPADELPGKAEGAFGLVWDGPSAETCEGAAGAYLRINHPHKVSLYLAAGMPVIIWEEAAAAELVRQRGCGLLIGSLKDAEKAVRGVSREEYEAMKNAARKAGEEMRAGAFLRRALAEAENRAAGR